MTPLHPSIVHFPIVLLLAAAGLYLAGWIGRKPHLEAIGFIFHAIGVVFCIAAILTGDMEAERFDSRVEGLVSQHELMGTVATYGFGLLGIWAFLRQKTTIFIEKIAFIVLYLGLYVYMGLGASLGGEMVYEHGLGVVSTPAERDFLDSVYVKPSTPLPSGK
jgi:uncharacterized membrane protein